MKPSIVVIIKIADKLDVIIDYLFGKTNLELDKQTLKRIEDIPNVFNENKNFVLQMIDMALQNFKTKQAFSFSAYTGCRSYNL